MKTAFITLALAIVVGVLYNAKSQNATQENAVAISSINIYPTNQVNNKFYLVDVPSKLNATFGAPLKSSVVFEEMYNANVARYEFNGLRISYVDDEIVSLHIVNKNFTVSFAGGAVFKVGDNISTVSSTLPNSYALRKENRIYVSMLAPDGSPTDGSIVICYNNSNIITDIIAG